MKKPWDTVKVKILLGYLFLAGIAILTVWLIYSEILLSSYNKSRIARLNNKILYFNSVLTNLYQAEALERTYSQTGNPVHYENYEQLMDTISLQFDTLSLLSDDPGEKLHTDSILLLLERKRNNIKELTGIRRPSSEALYKRAMERLNISRDSFDVLLNLRTTVTDKSESIYIEQKKKKFFERLWYAFNPKDSKDTLLLVSTQQTVQIDTIMNEVSPADSVIRLLTTIMEDIRKEDQSNKLQLARKQGEVLADDRTITLQLRRILSIFEKDIFVSSLGELNALQDRIRLTTWKIIALGILALIVIGAFLTMILKDITRSQRYRNELEKAKAYSDSLLKSKEQIMLSITHDIKSPITSVTGYARLMNETNDREKRKYYLENIRKSSDHILKLISDLTDLTRLETGKLKPESLQFSLAELVNDICSVFYPTATAKELEFRYECNIPGNSLYLGDPLRIKQVLGNILSNAIKYTDVGSVVFSVTKESSEDNTDHIRFDISDTGIGISEEHSRIIFNEFTRISGSYKHEGAGLGLSIAKRIVTLLNGEIALVSKPGEGSRFTVRLPLERSPEKDDATRKAGRYRVDNKNTVRIMAIDDDDMLLDMTAEIIEKSGMEVCKCNSAARAIRMLDTFMPELIITDIQMPSMSGTEMLSYIQRKTGKIIPVILVTGQDRPFTGSVKVSALLKKPFNPSELLKTIDQVLKRVPVVPVNNVVTDHMHPGINRYNLDHIRQFALDDSESMHKILTSFAESGYENLAFFNRYILENDRKNLSELAHKMLAMFRHLEAKQIVDPLMKIERDYGEYSDDEWLSLSRDTLCKIEQFLETLCEEQGITVTGSKIV